MRRLAVIVLAACLSPPTAGAGDIASHRKEAMAMENITLAAELCGHELTARAALLIAADRAAMPTPFAADRTIVTNLWRRTWSCDPDFIASSCIAARLQLCHRAYAEYGPKGVRMRGLIRAIVLK